MTQTQVFGVIPFNCDSNRVFSFSLGEKSFAFQHVFRFFSLNLVANAQKKGIVYFLLSSSLLTDSFYVL